jgi:hypothetical protein
MPMNIKLNTTTEFYLENDPIPKTGFILDIVEDDVEVRIEHGEMHGQVVVVNRSDIIDDSFDRYNASDEKLYAWYDGE